MENRLQGLARARSQRKLRGGVARNNVILASFPSPRSAAHSAENMSQAPFSRALQVADLQAEICAIFADLIAESEGELVGAILPTKPGRRPLNDCKAAVMLMVKRVYPHFTQIDASSVSRSMAKKDAFSINYKTLRNRTNIGALYSTYFPGTAVAFLEDLTWDSVGFMNLDDDAIFVKCLSEVAVALRRKFPGFNAMEMAFKVVETMDRTPKATGQKREKKRSSSVDIDQLEHEEDTSDRRRNGEMKKRVGKQMKKRVGRKKRCTMNSVRTASAGALGGPSQPLTSHLGPDPVASAGLNHLDLPLDPMDFPRAPCAWGEAGILPSPLGPAPPYVPPAPMQSARALNDLTEGFTQSFRDRYLGSQEEVLVAAASYDMPFSTFEDHRTRAMRLSSFPSLKGASFGNYSLRNAQTAAAAAAAAATLAVPATEFDGSWELGNLSFGSPWNLPFLADSFPFNE